VIFVPFCEKRIPFLRFLRLFAAFLFEAFLAPEFWQVFSNSRNSLNSFCLFIAA
jgi:hypothetical protein